LRAEPHRAAAAPQRLDERLPNRGANDEVDQLADEFNDLLDRIAVYLRNDRITWPTPPMSCARRWPPSAASVEVALGSNRSAEQYHELLADVIEETSAGGAGQSALASGETDVEKLQTHTEAVPFHRLVSTRAKCSAPWPRNKEWS